MQAAVKLKIQNLNPQNAGEAARKGAALVVEKKCFTVGAESLHRHMKYKPKRFVFSCVDLGSAGLHAPCAQMLSKRTGALLQDRLPLAALIGCLH